MVMMMMMMMMMTRKLYDFFFSFTIGITKARDRVLVFKRPKFVYCWLGRAIITPWGSYLAKAL